MTIVIGEEYSHGLFLSQVITSNHREPLFRERGRGRERCKKA